MRRRMSFKKHRKSFSKARSRTRAINSPSHFMRSGIRL